MTQQQFFERVLTILADLRIPCMATGSVGAMLYGEPRPDRVGALSQRFDSDEYDFPPVAAVLEAIAPRRPFNILHVGSGSKVDDIRGILAVSGSSLDAAYLDRWIAALGLEREWNAIRRTP